MSCSRAILLLLFCRCNLRKAARRATSLLVIGVLLTTAEISLAACANRTAGSIVIEAARAAMARITRRVAVIASMILNPSVRPPSRLPVSPKLGSSNFPLHNSCGKTMAGADRRKGAVLIQLGTADADVSECAESQA